MLVLDSIWSLEVQLKKMMKGKSTWEEGRKTPLFNKLAVWERQELGLAPTSASLSSLLVGDHPAVPWRHQPHYQHHNSQIEQLYSLEIVRYSCVSIEIVFNWFLVQLNSAHRISFEAFPGKNSASGFSQPCRGPRQSYRSAPTALQTRRLVGGGGSAEGERKS